MQVLTHLLVFVLVCSTVINRPRKIHKPKPKIICLNNGCFTRSCDPEAHSFIHFRQMIKMWIIVFFSKIDLEKFNFALRRLRSDLALFAGAATRNTLNAICASCESNPLWRIYCFGVPRSCLTSSTNFFTLTLLSAHCQYNVKSDKKYTWYYSAASWTD